MRSVLIVIGIAVLALGLSYAFGAHKYLVENPQILSDQRSQQEQADLQKKLKNQAAGKQTGAKSSASATSGTGQTADASESAPNPNETKGALHAVIAVKDRGNIDVDLYPKAAPKTVSQFVQLARSGFYNGILFHRVVPGFVVQAGDPTSKSYSAQDVASKDDGQGGTQGLGTAGSGKTIPFETNSLKNEQGTLAMALAGARSATGDSQFFINLKANHQLDGDYCVFGKVTNGGDVVGKIQRGDAITSITVK